MRNRSAIRPSRRPPATSRCRVASPGSPRRSVRTGPAGAAGGNRTTPSLPSRRLTAHCRRGPPPHEATNDLLEMGAVAKPFRRRFDDTGALDVDGSRPVHEHGADRTVGPQAVDRPQAAELAQGQPGKLIARFRPRALEHRCDGVDDDLARQAERIAREPGANLGHHIGQSGIDVARRHRHETRRRAGERGVGDGRRWRCGIDTGPRRRSGRRLAGELHQRSGGRTAGRRPTSAITLSKQLGNQAAQFIARERHAARAEVVVDDLADGIGDFRRRAAVAESRRHGDRHPVREGAPGLLHQACAIDIAAQGEDRLERTSATVGARPFEHGIQGGRALIEPLSAVHGGHPTIRFINDFPLFSHSKAHSVRL